jgi:DNA-directed RNA polymerase subunit RPC12/RpoP
MVDDGNKSSKSHVDTPVPGFIKSEICMAVSNVFQNDIQSSLSVEAEPNIAVNKDPPVYVKTEADTGRYSTTAYVKPKFNTVPDNKPRMVCVKLEMKEVLEMPSTDVIPGTSCSCGDDFQDNQYGLESVYNHADYQIRDRNTTQDDVTHTMHAKRGVEETHVPTAELNTDLHMLNSNRDKPYKYDNCMKSISRKQNLEEHVKLRTGDKPYTCVTCRTSFAQKNNLVRHLRIHTGDKLYKCDTCMKSFAHNHHLKRHVRVHTGDKPYKCATCRKSFSRKQHLVEHVKVHTGDKPNKCET